MSEEAVDRLLGIAPGEGEGKYSTVRVFQHRWDLPRTFRTVGTISCGDARVLRGGLLAEDVVVRLNRSISEHDHVVICGLVFSHGVADRFPEICEIQAASIQGD
jgi:hypothetical protein